MIKNLSDLQPKILVIGDLMIDSYLWGSCNRISPEAPVQVIDVNSNNSVLGGAGNVLNNLKSLNAEVSIMSVIGDCENSKELLNLLEKINISPEYLFKEENRVSSKKTRIISANQHVVRFDQETSKDISEVTEKNIIDKFSKIISKYNLVILSDYAKGLLTNTLTKKIIEISNKNNVKVIVDPKGKDYRKYENAYLLTPNKKEASEATGIKIFDSKSLEKALRKLKKICSLNVSLITLSEDGISVLDSKITNHPTVAREVYDVTGAGDTVIASLGYSIACNLDIHSSIRFANLAAGVVVGKVGSATTSFKEIEEYKSSFDIQGYDSCIKDFNKIKEIVSSLKKSRKTIAFTNGCFDILHIGHIKYLEQSRKYADVLIVGINSDSSVKTLKGPNRPVNNLKDRSSIIAALKSVDYVVPFNEQTPIKLIEIIKPDFLMKGGDYKNKQIVGSNIAKKTILIDFIEGKSTSTIINSIKNA